MRVAQLAQDLPGVIGRFTHPDVVEGRCIAHFFRVAHILGIMTAIERCCPRTLTKGDRPFQK